MKVCKNRLRNKMSDDFLGDSLVVYIEKEIAEKIDSQSVIEEFKSLKGIDKDKDKDRDNVGKDRVEGGRENSPVELDVSFQSNGLVAKAVATPSSLLSDTPSRNKKIKRGSEFGLPVLKFGERLTRSGSSSHGVDSPSSSEKASKTCSYDSAYLKYLTKKYLKKHNVRDWLRVIASNKERNVYELRYFNIAENEGEEEDPYVELRLEDQVVRSTNNCHRPFWPANIESGFQFASYKPMETEIVNTSEGFSWVYTFDCWCRRDTVPTDRIVTLQGGWGLLNKGSVGEILLRLTYKVYVEDEEDEKIEVDIDASDDEFSELGPAGTTYDPTSPVSDKETFMDVLAAFIVSEEFKGIVASEASYNATDMKSTATSSGQTTNLLDPDNDSGGCVVYQNKFRLKWVIASMDRVQMLEETIRQLKEDNTQIRARVEIETQVQVQRQVERQVQEHMRQRELEANAREEARERENYSDWLLTETSPTDFRRRLLSLFPTEFQQMTITDQESQTDLFRHKSVGNCH
ncbi:tricalbin-3 isoform X1 [Tanacetum coccineum]